jgi:NADPH2:quinone reductase
VQELGAREIINYREQDVIAEILRMTSGKGVDRIIEVDFGANLTVDHAVIKPNGAIAAYSSSKVREPVLPYYAFAAKGVTLHFVQGMLLTHERARAGIGDAATLLERSILVHPIAAVYSLQDTALAHMAMESGDTTGKILVRN